MNQHASLAAEQATGEGEGPWIRRNLRMVLLIGIPLLIVVIAVAWHIHASGYETTDNAFAQAGKLAVSTEVDGRVIDIAAQDEQVVKRGDILFRLDPEPFAIAVRSAEADLSAAYLDVRSMDADARSSNAVTGSSREQLAFAQREAARQKQLLAEGISSQSQYDQAMLNVQNAQQRILGAEAATASIQAKLGSARDPGSNPRILAAKAMLDKARRNLRLSVVRAPQDGVVSRVSQLQVGQYVRSGAPLFTIVSDHIWVEANFKESQLAKMKVGQQARISFDAFPGEVKAHVAAFSPGTGSSFSMLPPENATGNWVKVVQRVPVRLEIDSAPSGRRIVPGLSADVTVDIQ